MTAGIVAYGVYLPCSRLERKAIGEALGAPAGSGTRAGASYDEGTTPLGVEARRAPPGRGGGGGGPAGARGARPPPPPARRSPSSPTSAPGSRAAATSVRG